MFLLRLLALLIFAPALGSAAPASPPSDSRAKPEVAAPKDASREKEKNERPLPPPMVFFLARGEPGSCGPGCSEWIAADGTIDRGATQQLRALLRKTGTRKVPVYFHSPGGSVGEAIAIGRVLREYGLRAAVGRTIPQGCDPLQVREPACDTLKRSSRDLPAELRTARTLCNSACVYALLGGAVREVAPGARLGVHTAALRRIGKEDLAVSGRKLSSDEEQKYMGALTARLTHYMKEMGIDVALVEAASKIKHEDVRFLSRDEIARFRIDSREFHESRWMVDEGPPGPFSVLKYIVEAKGEGSKSYRTTRIRMLCRGERIGVQYDRELAAGDRTSASIAVTMRSGAFVLPPSRRQPTLGYNDISMETRTAWVPVAALADAGDEIQILEAPDKSAPDGARPRPTKLSTAGLASALAALRRNCR
jgi:hypothetical protein